MDRQPAPRTILYPNLYAQIQLYGAHQNIVGRGWTCPRHIHHMMFEINLVTGGCQTAVLDGTAYRQEAGDLILVSPMQLHEYRAERTGGAAFFVIHLQVNDPLFLQLLEQRNQGMYARGTAMNDALLDPMHTLSEQLKAGASRMQICSTLYSLTSRMEEVFTQEQRHFTPDPNLESAYRIAKEIEKLVIGTDANSCEIGGNWLDVIAASLGLSQRHCNRVFHQSFRLSPREYLAVLRQQEAMQMLVGSDETIERIGYRIGYRNVQSFSRQFKAWTGLTPSSFRIVKGKGDDLFYLTHLGEL